MISTTATPRQSKPRSKPAPVFGLAPTSFRGAYLLTVTLGKLVRCFYLKPIPNDFGSAAYELERFGADVKPGEDAAYHVCLDAYGPGRHECSCRGATAHGHCKHSEALIDLRSRGVLPAPMPANDWSPDVQDVL
jgi:hypothetical protein